MLPSLCFLYDFTWTKEYFTLALLVLLVTYIMSGHTCVTHIRFVRYWFVPLHILGHGGIVWCGTQWLVCLVWYGVVWYGWYAWYAAFSLMHIKYKYGSRDRDDFGDFFIRFK